MSNSRRLAKSHRLATHNALDDQQDQSWKQLKAADPATFNQGAERAFIRWLKTHLLRAKDSELAYGWIITNAAYELDVSIPTVQRYVRKLSADLAPFVVDGGVVRLRRPDLLPNPDKARDHD